MPEVLQQFDSSIVLYWDEPASNGGLLADYRLEYKHDLTGGANTWVVATDKKPGPVPIEFVLDGHEQAPLTTPDTGMWHFHVRATSSHGHSRYSGVLADVMPTPSNRTGSRS